MSASSIATEASFARVPDQNPPPVMNNPTPSMSSVPSLAAAGSSNPGAAVPLFTPPQTPGQNQANGSTSTNTSFAAAGTKREGTATNGTEQEEQGREKRRRIAPTLINESSAPAPPAAGDGGAQ
jgi:chromatin assembly factor 1 subunit B